MGAAPTKDGAPPAPTTGGRRASVAVKAVIQFHKLTHSPEIATPTAGLAPLAEEGASSEPPPSAPKTAPKTVAASKGQHIASALTYGARVMKDPPTNVFGPGHVVSPDMYADLHKTGPYDRFLLAFQKLEGEERLSAFVTYVYFRTPRAAAASALCMPSRPARLCPSPPASPPAAAEGKMGLLLRLCDSFCAADNMLGLFGILKEAATQVLALEHCRLWQVDRKRNVVVCVYHDGDDDAQNGRVLPSLGSFAGDVARNKKVVVCNAAREDSRFGSWQYKEMQERLREPLGSIMGVALLNAANEAQWVLECYTKDDRLLDGADAFLLQVVARLP